MSVDLFLHCVRLILHCVRTHPKATAGYPVDFVNMQKMNKALVLALVLEPFRRTELEVVRSYSMVQYLTSRELRNFIVFA